MIWRLSHRADQEARQIADRHYSRQKPGTPQFVPPGRCLVLVCDGAYWVTSWPFAEFTKHAWGGRGSARHSGENPRIYRRRAR